MEIQEHNDIIVALSKGDENALTDIYEMFYAPLYYFIRHILNDSNEAQETCADCFLKLWNLKTNFENLSNIKSFLYITARNASINVLKQKKREAGRNRDLQYFLFNQAEGPSSQDEIKAEVLNKVINEIENLPLQCKRIAKRSFIKGEKNAKIADDMGLTLQTVKNQKTRAIKLLKLTLAR